MGNNFELTTEDLAAPEARRPNGSPATADATRQTAGARAITDRHVQPTGEPATTESPVQPTAEPATEVSPVHEDGAGRPDVTTADMALLDAADETSFRQRWSDTQAGFVDDPREAVRAADGLVAELMQSLARGFSEHKARLEAHWQSGGDPDTEDLRRALQRYRSFFNRLLST